MRLASRMRSRIRSRSPSATAARIVFSGGSRPFGYDIVQDGDVQRMVPNAAEMAVIERMKSMRQSGSTYRAIGAVTSHGPKTVQRILDRMTRSR
jgi:hypothetical protein